MNASSLHVPDAVALGARHTFALDGSDVFVVQSGRIDVFVVRVEDGTETSRRRHLLRAKPGDPVFPVGASAERGGWTLLASGTGETEVRAVPLDALYACTACSAPIADACALLERWAVLLTDALSRFEVRPRPVDLETVLPGSRRPVPPDTGVGTTAPVAWVRTEDDGVGFMTKTSRPSLTPGCPVPLTEQGWLWTRDVTRLKTVSTDDVLSEGVVTESLHHFHALVYARLQDVMRGAVKTEQERLKRRTDARTAAVDRAFGTLASVLGTGSDRPSVDSSDDPHFAAAQRVAHDLGFDLTPCSAHASADYERAPLLTLARASGIQTRKVALRDAWWTKDNGPLYAQYEDDGRPIALLCPSPGRYEVHDPVDGSVTRVGPEVARRIHPFAFTLYRPLPRHPLSIRDVLRFGLKTSTGDLFTVVLMAAGIGLLSTATPVVTGLIFDSVIPAAERTHLVQLTAALLVSAVVAGTFRLTQSLALLRVQGRAFAALQSALWDRLLSLPLSFFRQYTSGDLATRAMGVAQLQRLVSAPVVASILGGVFSSFNVALLFYYSPTLALWATILGAFSLSVSFAGSAVQLRYRRKITAVANDVSSLVLQALTGISKLRIAGAEAKAFALWADRFGESRALQYTSRQIQNALLIFNRVYPLVVTLVLFSLAVPLVDAGTLRTGELLAFLAALTTFLVASTTMSQSVAQVFAAIPTYENVRPILRAVPEVDASNAAPGSLQGRIELQHVSFRYALDAPLVIDDLSMQIDAGEFVALVGPSGSGKSTLFNLLVGFEQPENGAIYYDDQDLHGLDVHAVRRQIGVVVQNGKLMPGDIFENIAGASLITLDDAWQAAELAELADDIRAMPMGMHTVVSDRTLSGGQVQRLMIARAVVGTPRILFFDEATSALDNKTQAQISRSLEGLQATRIAIAHRLSTVRNADRIFVIDRGRVAESGSYDTLMQQDGLFARLAGRQVA